MIVIAGYDARIDHERMRFGGQAQAVAMGHREPLATIDLRVVASGKDLDKFIAMLEALTGRAVPRSGDTPDTNAPLLVP